MNEQNMSKRSDSVTKHSAEALDEDPELQDGMTRDKGAGADVSPGMAGRAADSDLEYDTDLEPTSDSAGKTDSNIKVTPGRSSVDAYESYCRDESVLPFSAISRGLTQPFLKLRYQSVGCQAMKPFCRALATNQVVTVLNLEDTDLGQQGALYLADALKHNHFVKHLNVANNHVGNEGIGAITDTLRHQTTVSHLDISGNKLTDCFGACISALLQDNDSLLRLHVNYNCLRQDASKAIGKALGKNTALELLDLSWNCITGTGAMGLTRGIKKNRSLKTLDLSWNGLGYDGGQALSVLLTKNHSLQYIDVSNTRILWQNMAAIGKGLRDNNVLQILKIGGNPLTTTGSMALLESAGSDKCGLRLLDVTDVPVVAEFHLLGVAIQQTRPFHVIHGGVVHSHDFLGCQAFGTGLSGPIVQHPMQTVLEFIKRKQIRLLELFRCMDKAAVLKLSGKVFTDSLKKFGVPLNEYELRGLVRGISGKDKAVSEITYPKLARAVAGHVLRERTKKSKDTHEMEKNDSTVGKSTSSTQESLKRPKLKIALPKTTSSNHR